MDCSVLCSVRTNGTEHKASFTSVFLEVGKVFDFEMSHSEFATRGFFTECLRFSRGFHRWGILLLHPKRAKSPFKSKGDALWHWRAY